MIRWFSFINSLTLSYTLISWRVVGCIFCNLGPNVGNGSLNPVVNFGCIGFIFCRIEDSNLSISLSQEAQDHYDFLINNPLLVSN